MLGTEFRRRHLFVVFFLLTYLIYINHSFMKNKAPLSKKR
nr:MAG TPA: hypothetical protein [Caudoviricetes sp.]